jgi:DNA-binding NarL/FixJ family response regulator
MRTTVLIVDDHDGFRSRARALLQADGFEIVGEAEDAASAVEAAERLAPALVLLDVQLPDGDGFDVAERLMSRRDSPVVILVSARDASSYRRRLAETSARGFIAKSDLTGAALRSLVT